MLTGIAGTPGLATDAGATPAAVCVHVHAAAANSTKPLAVLRFCTSLHLTSSVKRPTAPGAQTRCGGSTLNPSES